ncbi:MAG: RNA 2',3'-cyclic phosphodiesterase [Candidatus Cloacimonetes bacterium]|nr:RNA 2',3'-cyclic phosphodiesterase [Candidatus Cloacimonadota bacterium]
MRVFLAFELPEPIRDELSAIIESFRNAQPRGVNWVVPENLHITLLFLGEVPGSLITGIDNAVEQTLSNIPSFEVTNPRVQIIPPGRPRLIWVRWDTAFKPVFRLPGRLRDGLAELGVEADVKPLKLHCTLGRVKTKIDEQTLASMMGQTFGQRAFHIDEASLYESVLRPQGPVYTRLRAYHLTRRTHA